MGIKYDNNVGPMIVDDATGKVLGYQDERGVNRYMDGRVMPSTEDGSGAVVGLSEGDGLNANTEDTSTVSIARQIKASAGRVTSITCLTGTTITLTLYDNAAATASGRQIYSAALSAGDVVYPTDAWFGQGCFASFTGGASFVIATSEAAE